MSIYITYNYLCDVRKIAKYAKQFLDWRFIKNGFKQIEGDVESVNYTQILSFQDVTFFGFY